MTATLSSTLLRTQTDARLVAYAQAGHEPAFEALVQRYRKPLLSYCRRLLLPEARAEDVVQQAFLSAWTALAGGTEVIRVRAWLYRITHNAAINALKRSGYDYAELNDALYGADAPQDDLERRIAIRETLAAMAHLPELQREALIRTAIEGQSHEQVALDLGLTGTMVRGLVYRARVSVRSAASALTPPQLIVWATSRMHGAPLRERVGELVAGGGGSAGLATALLKGGAVVVAAGALATGTGTLPLPSHASAQAGHGHDAHEPTRATSRPSGTLNLGLTSLRANAAGYSLARPVSATSGDQARRAPRVGRAGARTGSGRGAGQPGPSSSRSSDAPGTGATEMRVIPADGSGSAHDAGRGDANQADGGHAGGAPGGSSDGGHGSGQPDSSAGSAGSVGQTSDAGSRDHGGGDSATSTGSRGSGRGPGAPPAPTSTLSASTGSVDSSPTPGAPGSSPGSDGGGAPGSSGPPVAPTSGSSSSSSGRDK